MTVTLGFTGLNVKSNLLYGKVWVILCFWVGGRCQHCHLTIFRVVGMSKLEGRGQQRSRRPDLTANIVTLRSQLSLKPVFLGEWSCSSLPNLLWRFDFAICFSRVKRPMHVIFAWYLTKLWSCGWDVLSKSLHQQFDLERIWGGCLKWKYKKCNLCTKKYAPLSHLQPHTHTHTRKKNKKISLIVTQFLSEKLEIIFILLCIYPSTP